MNKRIGVASLVFVVTLLAILFVAPPLIAETVEQESLAAIPEIAVQALGVSHDDMAPATGVTLDAGSPADDAPGLDATRRISIPYGFESPLPVLVDGDVVLASGHGGCTLDEQVTVMVTVTQSTSGAVATGETAQTCTGELQIWSLRASVDTPGAPANGPAEACGLATTRSAGYVTDTYSWCVDVDLITLNNRVYLPIAANQSTQAGTQR